MALSFVGQASAAAASASLPAFTAGDLAIVFAFRDGNTTAPTLPSGWTGLGSAGANTCSARWGFRILQAGDTTTGTWTNATAVEVYVITGVDAGNPIPAFQSAGSTGASASPSWSSFGTLDLTGRDWLIFLGGHRTATDMSTVALSGTVNESPATTNLAMHDIQGANAAWSTTSKVVNANSGWVTAIIEVAPATPNVARVSQVAVEAVELPAPALRVSQTAAEVVELHAPALRASQVVIETVAQRTNVAIVSQVVAEVIHQNLPAGARTQVVIIG